MKKLRILKIALPLAGILALAAGAGLSAYPWADEPSASVSEDGAFRFHYPVGATYTYGIEIDTDETLAPSNSTRSQVRGHLHLEGKLRLRSYGPHDGRYRLGVSLPELSKHELAFQDRNLLGQGAGELFGEREAFIEVTDRGQLHKIWYPKDCPETFRSVMDTVIPTVVATAPEQNDPMWISKEPTPFGVAESFYSSTEGQMNFLRNRAEYKELKAFGGSRPKDTRVTSSGTVTFDPAGHVASINTSESVTVGDERFSATLSVKLDKQSVANFEPPKLALADFEAAEPGKARAVKGVQRRLWKNMVGDMTLTHVEQGIAAFAQHESKPPEGWFTRSMLLIRMNPAYATRLSDMFQGPGMTNQGRSMICDILAASGTPAAQKALADALSSEAAMADPDAYPSLLQRFSFVKRPTKDTMAFLEQTLSSPPTDQGRLAAAQSLGAAAGKLARAGEDVRTYNGQLLAGLDGAKTPVERDAFVDALGNAGLEENVPVLADMTQDENPAVRLSVARALRKTDTPEAREVLFDMVGDRRVLGGARRAQDPGGIPSDGRTWSGSRRLPPPSGSTRHSTDSSSRFLRGVLPTRGPGSACWMRSWRGPRMLARQRGSG